MLMQRPDHGLVQPEAAGDIDGHHHAVTGQHVEIAAELLQPRVIQGYPVPWPDEVAAFGIDRLSIRAADEPVPSDADIPSRYHHRDPLPDRDHDENGRKRA